MTTYDGAYSKRDQKSEEKKVTQRFKTISAGRIDVRHYHGSWFEYTWDITYKDEDGNIIRDIYYTWTDYKTLQDKEIEFDGNTFKVIEGEC